MCLVIFPLTIGGNKQAFFAPNNSKRKCEKRAHFLVVLNYIQLFMALACVLQSALVLL